MSRAVSATSSRLATAAAALASALEAQMPNAIEEPDTVLTVDEAAAQLSVSRSLIYTMIRTGQLDSMRVGRRRFIPVTEVEKLVDSAM
jgi:excisionase family DNA binding protein